VISFFTKEEQKTAAMKKKLSLAFTAGCIGGLLNGLIVWMFGVMEITAALGVKISPALSPAMLYPRIVWGGLWGLLFLLPFMEAHIVRKGLFLSLGPTMVQLFIVFPLKAQKGFMGLELGALTPLFVVFFNAVWGLAAAFWMRRTETVE
jgi:hypothetical protein